MTDRGAIRARSRTLSALSLCARTAGVLVSVVSFAGCAEQLADRGPGFPLLSGEQEASGFARVQGPANLVFPRDHGPHPEYRLEWWYVTSILESSNGREFGVQFTLFRLATSPRSSDANSPWRTGQMYHGHFALSDVAERIHIESTRSSRGHPKLAGAVAEPFRAYVDGWELASEGTDFTPLRLSAASEDYAVNLSFEQQQPVFLHGEAGLSRKTPESSSFYYSVPRMRAHGSLSVGGAEFEVSGSAWMDREWSSEFLGGSFVGWDWFALQLDDGRSMVLFRIRPKTNASPVERSAVVIDSVGTGSYLDAADWHLEPTRHALGYPVEWSLTVPGFTSTIVAAFDDQRMDTEFRYWEGLVYVEQRGHRVGKGYMELVGY